MMRHAFAIAMTFSTACGSGKGDDGDDDTPDASERNCGQPGATGNEVGVGQYCVGPTDCASAQCLADLHGGMWCSLPCTVGAVPSGCGTDAVCHQAGNTAFCVLNACLPL